MPALAAWLIARPINAVLGLAATQSLPLLGFLSGAVLVYLVLAQGLRTALIEAVVAGSLIALLALVLGQAVEPKLAVMAMTWLPAAVFGVLLLRTRSLALTLQVTAIVAVVGLIAFYAIAGNPVAFWSGWLDEQVASWRASGLPQLQQQAAIVEPEIRRLAESMTIVIALAAWFAVILAGLLGYGLYRAEPSKASDYGRFVDLDFGRIIAGCMAIASVLAIATGMVWLQSVAFVIFAMFSVQGVAIVHWLHAHGMIPLFVVVLVYGALIVVITAPVIVTAMAVLGYIDAWFRLRRRKLQTG